MVVITTANILIATQIISGLTKIALETSVAASKWVALMEKAQSEGRDISDGELDELRAQSNEAERKVLDKLEQLKNENSEPN